MPVVQIPVERIHDWDSFHDVFTEVLGFPDFYGRSVAAWVDCLTDADLSGDGHALSGCLRRAR
jgi:RNAse (barnase) inhibitor barstar